MSRGRSSLSGGRSSSHSSGGSFRSGSFRSSGRRYGGSYRSYNGGFGFGFLMGSLLGRNNTNNVATEQNTDNGTAQTQPAVKYKKVRNKKATLIACAIFGIITLLFIGLSIANRFDNVYGRVSGRVESVYSVYEYGEKYYYTSYEYEVDGVKYSAESQSGWTLLPESMSTYIGSYYDLYYKKDNPYIIYEIEDKENIPSTQGIYIWFAVVMGIVTVAIALVGINKYEVDQEHIEAQAKIQASVLPDGKKRCAYCSNINNQTDNKCSSCGAPLK